MNVRSPAGTLRLRPQDCHSIAEAKQLFRNGEIALDDATSIEQTLNIRDMAVAAGIYYRQVQRSIEAQNQATILRIKAERKLGQFLDKLQLRGGDRKSADHSNRPTLADYGIRSHESKRAQKLAAISSEQLTQVFAEYTAERREITIAAVLKAIQPAKPKPVRDESELPLAPAEPVMPLALSPESSQTTTAPLPDAPIADFCILSTPACEDALNQVQESICHLNQAISMMDDESPASSVSGKPQRDSIANKPAMHPRHYIQEAINCVGHVKMVLAREIRNSTG